MEAYRVEMLRIPHFLDCRLTDGDEVVSLTCQLCFTLQKHFLVLISVRGLVNPTILQLEGLGKLKRHSVTSMGIEHATFWLVE
jgi:hypothetical protein